MSDKSPLLLRLEAAQRVKLATLPADPVLQTQIVSALADFFAAAWLKIGLKEAGGGLAPFVLNPVQMDHLAGLRQRHRRRPGADMFRGIRDLILKPRRLGFSTYIGGLYFLDGLMTPGTHTTVMAHTDDVVSELFDIYKIFYETLPLDVRARVKSRRMSTSEMILDFYDEDGGLDLVARPPSTFTVATAGGKDKRGITPHNLHLSEAAFYDNWSLVNRSIVQAVSDGGNVILESTARGMNHYKDLVDAALDHRSLYRLIFYPWFAFPEYRLNIDPGQAETLSRTLDKEERALVDRGVSLPQLAWRRMKLSGMDLSDFHQEFPSSVLEAFISTGRPVFAMQIVSQNFEKTRNVPFDQRDEFTKIFAPPVPGAVYVLSADPSEGIDKGEGDPSMETGGTDFSSGSVKDAATLRTVATIHGRLDPPEFARRLAELGEEYNWALIAVERNNHGHTVLYALELSGYPNLYRHLEFDAAGTSYLKLGFPTTPQTRPLVIEALREVIKRDAYPCPDVWFWREAQNFVFNPLGKAEAMPGKHDDRIIDHAIGTYLCTMGAGAWGGAGLLQSADGAGLPIGKATVVRVEAPSPLAQVRDATEAHPPLGSSLAMSFPSPFASTSKAGDSAPVSPEVESAPAAPHAALGAVAEARAALVADGVVRCGVCLHRKPINGQLVCGLHGWKVKPEDPDCGMGELPAEVYNDQTVHRVSIGGVQ